jgi:DNA-binding NtrC family response regulator
MGQYVKVEKTSLRGFHEKAEIFKRVQSQSCPGGDQGAANSQRTGPGIRRPCQNQINLWKKKLLESAPGVFSTGKDREAERLAAQREILYRKVGQLQVEVDWLKKKTGLLV